MVSFRESQIGVADFHQETSYFLFDQEYYHFYPWWSENKDQFLRLSFNIKNQSNQFLDDLQAGKDFDTAFSKIRMDLWGYYLEYIKQQGILPFTNRIKNGRLVGDFYGDKPIVEAVDPQEREGAVLKAMEDLEQKMLNASIGDIYFRVSPKGWTGMGYDYTETQIQLFWKESDEIVRGLTIRTDLDLAEIFQLISLLTGAKQWQFLGGGADDELAKREIIKVITASNFFLENVKGLEGIAQTIEIIAQVSGNRDHRGNGLIDQFYQWVNSDSQFIFYGQIVGLIEWLKKELSQRFKEGKVSPEEVGSLLAFTIIHLGERGRREREELEFGRPDYSDFNIIFYDTRYPPLIDYQQIVNFLLAQPGCAGGGESQDLFGNIKLTPFGTTRIESSYSDRYPDYQCPSCGRTIQGEKKDHPEEWKTRCPHCGYQFSCAKTEVVFSNN